MQWLSGCRRLRPCLLPWRVALFNLFFVIYLQANREDDDDNNDNNLL
jgi:hypothetical protein